MTSARARAYLAWLPPGGAARPVVGESRGEHIPQRLTKVEIVTALHRRCGEEVGTVVGQPRLERLAQAPPLVTEVVTGLPAVVGSERALSVHTIVSLSA